MKTWKVLEVQRQNWHKESGSVVNSSSKPVQESCEDAPESTITEALPHENERLEAVPTSTHTVQPSCNLVKLAKQTTAQEHSSATGKKMDENWPPLNNAVKRTNARTSLCSRKNEIRKGGHAQGEY
uniref:Uncharacterized protein n=1 Tax=Parascaris univalens TaxID=6257 RepID=A0A915A4S6_PARUN